MIVHRQLSGAFSRAAFILLAGASFMASAQTPPVALDPESFLPPAPAWSGASEKLIVPSNDKWVTPSEKTGLTASPTYDETVAFLKKVDKASALVRVETFGTTPQGRKLVAAMVTKDGGSSIRTSRSS